MLVSLKQILKGDVKEIPFEFDYSIDLEEQFKTTGIIEATPIHTTGKVARVSSELFLEMQLEGKLTFLCTRCLNQAEYDFKRNLNKVLRSEETDELEMIHYENSQLDMKKIIQEEIMISLPTQVLCSENCKGLCPDCGINLNEETCDCEDKKIDPRFEVLDDFFS